MESELIKKFCDCKHDYNKMLGDAGLEKQMDFFKIINKAIRLIKNDCEHEYTESSVLVDKCVKCNDIR